MESIGKRIRKQRLHMALSLDELAARSGVSKPYLSLIEGGKTKGLPRDAILERLSAALNLPDKLLVMQARLWQTPMEIRLILAELASEREDNQLLRQAMREVLG